jgi:hypothetical protein
MKKATSPKKSGRPRRFDDAAQTEVIHMRVGGNMLARINDAWRSRGLPTRVETVRAIVAEALGVK